MRKHFFDERENKTGMEIEPCPFCGAEAVLLANDAYWNPTWCVSCSHEDDWGHDVCRGVKHPNSFDPENPVEAIRKWNMRKYGVSVSTDKGQIVCSIKVGGDKHE